MKPVAETRNLEQLYADSHIWMKDEGNPIFPTRPGTWMDAQTANPDLLQIGDTYHMYFRGQQKDHDRIGLATASLDKFDGITWSLRTQPVIDVGEPGTWDESHVLDPATVFENGRVYLYYSAVSPLCDRSICLATSDDGILFRKFEDNPVIIGGAPEVIVRNGVFYLYFWKANPLGRGFQIHLATSADGFSFKELQDNPVLAVGLPGSWDSHTVETPRIFQEDDIYYMSYCASDRYDDYPSHAGLAVSDDLVNWRKSKFNPVFSRGEEGTWDEGAIWFTTVEKVGGTYYMWYEGYGGGDARTEPYGSYLQGGKSQVGMARLRPAGHVDP